MIKRVMHKAVHLKDGEIVVNNIYASTKQSVNIL